MTWYSRTGAAWLQDRAPHWALRLGVRPTEVKVNGLGQRWGKRTKNGEIVLHWAVFQLPAHLIDLVLVHELAHLAQPHHGGPSASWSVDCCPITLSARKKLPSLAAISGWAIFCDEISPS